MTTQDFKNVSILLFYVFMSLIKTPRQCCLKKNVENSPGVPILQAAKSLKSTNRAKTHQRNYLVSTDFVFPLFLFLLKKL